MLPQAVALVHQLGGRSSDQCALGPALVPGMPDGRERRVRVGINGELCVHPEEVFSHLDRLIDRADRSRAVEAPHGRVGVRSIRQDDHDPIRRIRREPRRQLIVDLPGAGVAGKDLGVRLGQLDSMEGQGGHDHDRDGADRHGDRIGQDELRQREPSAPARHSLQGGRSERIHPLAEHRQHSREEEEADGGRGDGHQGASDADRIEEALRKDAERDQGDSDGQTAVQDHSPDGRRGRRHGRLDRALRPELLPESSHEEEAVVDRETEAEPGDDVDRKRVDVDHLGERR